jgi:meso-butanediol dehydrogenase/(S,S)-butanediol dehydrogenase/diacetyl reductase|tara:strand:- start:3898 stop:4725 length:828 start_codon:yes stop_codon:yes gene_type:complete
MKLEGRVAVVTGGGQGIGEGIVRCLANEGADVVVVDLNGDTAAKVADEVVALGRKSLAIQSDVTDSEQVGQTVQEIIDSFGQIDILVNDVGGGVRGKRPRTRPAGSRQTFVDIDEDVWDRTFELNAKTQFLMCRAVVPHFLKQESGKIVNIGSRLAVIPDPQLFTYCVTKAAVVHFTSLLATELAPHNINVNCVCPGDVLTPNIARIFERAIENNPDAKGKTPEEMFLDIAKPRIPMQRLQTPEDMGNAVVFLVSEDARNITGQALYVDGGQVMG